VGQCVLISGRPKAGKALVSMDFSFAIARGDSIGGQLYAEKGAKVLYVDAVSSLLELKSRIKIIDEIYDDEKDAFTERLQILCLNDAGINLDLTNAEDQNWLYSKIQGAKVIFFNNLGSLVGSSQVGDGDKWGSLFGWLKRLNKKGVSIVALHDNPIHSKWEIDNEIDLVLSVKRPNKWAPAQGNISEIHYASPRTHDTTQLIPFSFNYFKRGGRFGREFKLVEGYSDFSKRTVSDVEITNHKLSGLEVEMLTIARSGIDIQANNFKSKTKGRSRATIRNSFNKLCKKNLLSRHGKTKGIKYSAI